MAETLKPRAPAVATAAQNAHSQARAVLERFTSTPGKALVELSNVDLVVVHTSEIIKYQKRIEELETDSQRPFYEVHSARAIVAGPIRIAPNLLAWFDAAGNVAQLEATP